MRSKVVYLLALCLLTAGFQSCGTQGPEIQSQWNGARVAFLGDSITDEGQLKSQDIYWHQLVKILGIKPFCYGISGHQTSHILGQAEKLNDEHGQDVDAIRDNIASLGANTQGAKFNFGNFFRTTDKVDAGKGLDAHNVMDMRYFSGRVLRSIMHKKMLMLENGVDVVYTIATAAYRTAANREEILDFIRERARINVRILSKIEEAEATLFAYAFTSAYRAQLLRSSVIMMN